MGNVYNLLPARKSRDSVPRLNTRGDWYLNWSFSCISSPGKGALGEDITNQSSLLAFLTAELRTYFFPGLCTIFIIAAIKDTPRIRELEAEK